MGISAKGMSVIPGGDPAVTRTLMFLPDTKIGKPILPQT
jgi:hypothetical protein